MTDHMSNRYDRLVATLEGLIEGWRSFAQMCAAYRRVRAEVNSLRGSRQAKRDGQ